MNKKLTNLLAAAILTCAASTQATAQQVSEKLNRAPVAVKTSQGILVSWRSLKDDPEGATFRIYRNGTQLATNITDVTNYLDKKGNPDDVYQIVMIQNGSEVETTQTTAWSNMFTTIKVNRPTPQKAANGALGYYRPDDISVGDLDGDGNYELVLKWMPDNQKDNGSSGYTSPCILDTYTLDGKQLWRINLGLNIRSGNHYTQFLVYDFDGDGKAEVICKTAPGSTDGLGKYVTQAGTEDAVRNADNTKTYTNSNGHISEGEEFLTVFNGATGAAMHTIFYSPARDGSDFALKATSYGGKSIWGDTNLNRGNRHNAAVAYLDGLDKLPSAILQRGYYTRNYIWAVDWDGTQLTTRWLHKGTSSSTWSVVNANGKSTATGSGSSSYGQGNHSIAVGDVNGDGYDEIVTGAATIAHDGKLLCTTGLGHGDATHLADLCPDRPGLEVMMPHEESPYGYDVHDATTGEIITSATGSSDNGRGLACDFIPARDGSEFWSSSFSETYSCVTGKSVLSSKTDTNFRIYWTGDPYDQTFDGRYSTTNGGCSPRICNYNSASGSINTFQTFYDYGTPATCNTTKATPCLQADILGDWREEIIMYQSESDYSSPYCYLMLFSTPEPTKYKVPCLMQDHLYRMGIAWQNSSYNQPPHLGYSLADSLGVKGSTYRTQTTSHAPEKVDPIVSTDGAETLGTPSEDKGTVTGVSYTAGANGEITASQNSSGFVKVRTGNDDRIVFQVNSGYVITGISITAYSNNSSTTADRSIDLTGIYVDSAEESLLTDAVTFPGGTAGQTAVTVDKSGFEAHNTITLTFDNSKITDSATDANGKNKQLQAIIRFTYSVYNAVTGVTSVTSETPVYFDLLGRKVQQVHHGEVYVVNGKKVKL